jgi:putative N6-adenine-specific DNA methylase
MTASSQFPSGSRVELFASTALGLESIAAGELKNLGMRGRQETGGVAFAGDLDHLYRANLWLRTASRIVVKLGRFHASTFYELERRAKKLAWEVFLPASGSVRLRVTCRKSRLYHSDAVAERVMSAIAGSASRAIEASSDSLDDEGEEADNAAQLFVVRIVHDQVEISVDSSGELLHRRGYRREVAKAPLRETLAAAMVLASGWRRGELLLDPMCGSGTIPIEAALIARGIAPGAQRKFQFMNWPTFSEHRWNAILESARSSGTNASVKISGSDRDAGAIGAAGRNADRAGVGDTIEFSEKAISDSLAAIEDVEKRVGWVITNPPYGVRIGEGEDLRNLYARLGAELGTKPGWRVGVLTSDTGLVGQTRLSMVSRFDTRNGGIPVSFMVSEKPGQPHG